MQGGGGGIDAGAQRAARASELDDWLAEITETLAAHDRVHPERLCAPFAVNQIVHKSNDRLEADMATTVKHEVPIVITSLGARTDVNDAVHAYGGHTLHDVINDTFARKAVEKGADGLIAVAAGAGGHAGSKSPFALVTEIRQWFEGPLLRFPGRLLRRCDTRRATMGADFAYIGSAFIATHEARAADEYKHAVVAGTSDDIVYTSLFTGVLGNYLASSIRAAGLDPSNLAHGDPSTMNFADEGPKKAKAWKEIWGAGRASAPSKETSSAAEYIEKLKREYLAARKRLALWRHHHDVGHALPGPRRCAQPRRSRGLRHRLDHYRPGAH